MLYFLVILLWTVVERFVAGVGVSSNRTGLMEFAFGRASDTWDVPVFSVATRNITTQHLFQVKTSILGKKKITEIPPKITWIASTLCRKNEVSQWEVWALSASTLARLQHNRAAMRLLFLKLDIQKNDCHRQLSEKQRERAQFRREATRTWICWNADALGIRKKFDKRVPLCLCLAVNEHLVLQPGVLRSFFL